jgi:hypothetical protein
VNTGPVWGFFRVFGRSSIRDDRGMENIDDARGRGPRRSSPILLLLDRLAASVAVSSGVEIVAVSKRPRFGRCGGNAVEPGAWERRPPERVDRSRKGLNESEQVT